MIKIKCLYFHVLLEIRFQINLYKKQKWNNLQMNNEVRNMKKNLAVEFYGYQKAYNMAKHHWMEMQYGWMGISEKNLAIHESLWRAGKRDCR